VRASPGPPQYHNEIRLVRLRQLGIRAHIRPKHRLQRFRLAGFLPAELSMMVVCSCRPGALSVRQSSCLCRPRYRCSSPDLTHRTVEHHNRSGFLYHRSLVGLPHKRLNLTIIVSPPWAPASIDYRQCVVGNQVHIMSTKLNDWHLASWALH